MTLQSPAIKLFVGYKITAILKAHLRDPSSLQENSPLILTYFEGSEFVGLYLEQKRPSMEEVRALKEEVKRAMHEKLPEIHVDTLPISVFPQVFLS